MVIFKRLCPFLLLFYTSAIIAEEGTVLIDTEKGIDTTADPAAAALKGLSDILRKESGADTETTSEESTDAVEETPPASEPTILIDNTQETDSIDEPVITEDIPGSSPEFTSEPTILFDKTQGVDRIDEPVVTEDVPGSDPGTSSEPTILIDKTQDIEKVVEPAVTEEMLDSSPAPTSESNVLIDKEKGIDKTTTPEADKFREVSKSLQELEDSIAEPAVKPAPEPVVKPEPVLPVIAPVEPAPVKAVETKPAPVLPVIKPKPVETEEQKMARTERWTPRDNDLRILEVRIAQFKLEDVIPAYKYEDVVLLPLGLISELLDIAITTEPGFARGFVLKEEWTFMMDLSRAEVVQQGKTESFDKALVHELDDDIYVESNLLSQWLHMSFDIDLFSSRMWIKSDEKLPFVKRMEREERIKKSLARLNRSKATYPKHHEAHKNWSVPFVDQTVRVGLVKTQNGETDTTFDYTTHVSADLLKHESSWFLTGDDNDFIDDFRVRMSRHDNDAELLGFMKASEYAFGHVSEPRLNLITSSASLEPGVSVNNYPLGRQFEYDKRRFRGTLLPGWEVELYQNNALIGYQGGPVEGLYDFPDIPLLFGKNHFRLVFYGPQGQIREEEQHLNVNQSLTQKGKHYYSATATSDEDGGSRATAQYDYGITQNISSSFALVNIPLDDGTERVQHNYTKAGLRGFWDSYLLSLDFVSDSESGSAVELDLQTQFADTVVGFKRIQLSDFFSEEFLPGSAQVASRTNINLNTAIPPSYFPRMPLNFGLRQDEFENGTKLVEFTNRISANARGYAMTNFLTRQKTTGQDALFNGSFQLSTNINRYRVRGSVNYEFQPDTELTNLAATMDAGMYKGYNMTYGISHSLDQDVTEYSASANKATGKYNLSFGARLNSNNEIFLDATLSLGFGYEPRRHQWDSKAGTIANQGSVSARVFIDSDQDGIYSENDEPIQDVGFTINGGYSADRTSEDGIVFLTGLPPYEPTNVVIAPETMTDPLWTTVLEGVQVTPRPGHAILLDFPVFMSGEVDGTVYLSRNNRDIGVGKVTVELVDDQGRVVRTAETAYDGFYVMTNIPLGEYRMRVSNEQLERLGLNLKSEDTVNLSAEELFVNGVDFTLSPK